MPPRRKPRQLCIAPKRRGLWLTATHPLRCEGLDPFAVRALVAVGHEVIGPGERYWKKLWQVNGIECNSNHCAACALEMNPESVHEPRSPSRAVG